MTEPNGSDPSDRTTALGRSSGSWEETLAADGALFELPELKPGTMLGHHRIIGVLGRGGMGVVYDAEDTLLGRPVAVKVLPESIGADPRVLERFLQEARAAARLHHTNVVTIFEIGRQEGLTYLVMEKVHGRSLAEEMTLGPMPWQEATSAIIQACLGLAMAHRAGLIHRDIKPANLLRNPDGTVKIADFGLAKLNDELGGRHLTQTGRVVGTPAYMSPEQCQSDPLDSRSDLYSLGATYFGLLSGQGPYSNSTSVPKVMFAHCYKPPPDPRETVPTVPEGCAAVVARAMAKSPGDRYPDADTMRADLEALLAKQQPPWASSPTLSAVSLPKPPMPPATELSSPALPNAPRPAARWTRRAAVGAGIAALGSLSVFGLLAGRSSRDQAAEGGGPEPEGEREGASASASAAAAVPDGPPIRVGILHSLSGTMADSEAGVVDGTLLAIEEINANGGVLGRPIEAVVADGRSKPETFAVEARRLIESEGVEAIFGCWTSASRKAVRPIVEQFDRLIFYPVQHEGLEASPNIVYLGSTPNQQLLPAVKWAFVELGRRFFHVGSDYIFPRAAGAILRDQVEALGGEIVGEAFRSITSSDFVSVVDEIKAAEPDVILNTINGDGNVTFFRDLRAAGIQSSDIPSISFSIAEPEVRHLGLDEMAGDYTSWNYFMTVDRPENRSFIERFQARYGPQRVTSDPIATAYVGVHLWADAVRKAASTDTSAVRSALGGLEFEAPGCKVRVDPENLHLWQVSRIARLNDEGEFEIINSSGSSVRPEPFPKSRTRAQWESFLEELQRGWGGRWSAPE